MGYPLSSSINSLAPDVWIDGAYLLRPFIPLMMDFVHMVDLHGNHYTYLFAPDCITSLPSFPFFYNFFPSNLVITNDKPFWCLLKVEPDQMIDEVPSSKDI